MRHKAVELHKDSQKVQACGLTLSQITVVPGPARELNAQQIKCSKSSSFGTLLLCIEFGIPTLTGERGLASARAKWQAVSKHDIKTKHSKNLICDGYLKDMSQGSCSIGSRPSGLPTHNIHNSTSIKPSCQPGMASKLRSPALNIVPQPRSDQCHRSSCFSKNHSSVYV